MHYSMAFWISSLVSSPVNNSYHNQPVSHAYVVLSMYGVTNTLVFSLCASFVLNTEKIPSGPAGTIGFAFVLQAAMQVCSTIRNL